MSTICMNKLWGQAQENTVPFLTVLGNWFCANTDLQPTALLRKVWSLPPMGGALPLTESFSRLAEQCDKTQATGLRFIFATGWPRIVTAVVKILNVLSKICMFKEILGLTVARVSLCSPGIALHSYQEPSRVFWETALSFFLGRHANLTSSLTWKAEDGDELRFSLTDFYRTNPSCSFSSALVTSWVDLIFPKGQSFLETCWWVSYIF